MGPFFESHGEFFGDARTCDPDDLAIMVGTLLVQAGRKPHIALVRNEEDFVTAIEVREGQHRVASFDCYPMKMSGAVEAMITDAMARCGRPTTPGVK